MLSVNQDSITPVSLCLTKKDYAKTMLTFKNMKCNFSLMQYGLIYFQNISFEYIFSGSGPTNGPVLVYPSEMDGVPKISMPTFAMAAYKLKGSIWMKKGVSESQVANSLLQAADNWLRLVQVNHPDYQFFKTHGTYYG